jgi:hypothetical protein
LTGRASESDNDRNLAWELVLASLIATFATDVTKAEPDIVCDYKGQRLGIAAKVPYSVAPETHLDRIKHGARQLERSSAAHGFVVVNLVQLFPHFSMFRKFSRSDIRTNAQAVDMIDVWVRLFVQQYDLDQWARRFRDMHKILSIMFFVPTVLPLRDSPNPMAPYYGMHLVSVGGREEAARAFEQDLNWSCQTALSFSS